MKAELHSLQKKSSHMQKQVLFDSQHKCFCQVLSALNHVSELQSNLHENKTNISNPASCVLLFITDITLSNLYQVFRLLDTPVQVTILLRFLNKFKNILSEICALQKVYWQYIEKYFFCFKNYINVVSSINLTEYFCDKVSI